MLPLASLLMAIFVLKKKPSTGTNISIAFIVFGTFMAGNQLLNLFSYTGRFMFEFSDLFIRVCKNASKNHIHKFNSNVTV